MESSPMARDPQTDDHQSRENVFPNTTFSSPLIPVWQLCLVPRQSFVSICGFPKPLAGYA